MKDKVLKVVKKYPKTKDLILEKEKELASNLLQSKKSPRKLAIAFQNKIKNKGNSWPQSNRSRP